MQHEIRSYELLGDRGKKGNILDCRISTLWEKKRVTPAPPLMEADLSTLLCRIRRSSHKALLRGSVQHNGQSLLRFTAGVAVISLRPFHVSALNKSRGHGDKAQTQ